MVAIDDMVCACRKRADHIVNANGPQMRIRTRKFIGTIALFSLAIIWSLLAMALAQSVLTSISGFTAVIYYVIAGLGWVLPAMPIVSWMSKPYPSPSLRAKRSNPAAG